MTQAKRTGEERVADYSEALSRQLARAGARYGLDTARMAELTQLVSMATATHSQNISQLRATLMSGLKGLSWTTSEREKADGVLTAVIQASEGVRYAAVVRKPNKPTKVIAYMD